MLKVLYKNINNLFQSDKWLAFQKDTGKNIISFGDYSGIEIGLPLNKKAIWVQKGPRSLDISKLKNIAKEKSAIFVRVEPLEKINLSGIKIVAKKSLLSGQASPKATQILNISEQENDLLKNMKPKTRYNIRLSEKKGVKVSIVDDADILHKLLVKTSNRDKGYSPHELTYYKKMIEILSKDDTVHVFVAEYEGEFLAAILVSFYGEVATYLHGGFDDSKRNLMAPYLCQWEAIKYAKERNCKYYDFWGVAETEDPKDPWSGITRFKEGFGGEKVIFSGTYDIILNNFWYNILTIGAKVKHLIRK